MSALDLGCGMGDVSLLAARLVGPSGHVTAIDRDSVLVESARERCRYEERGANIEFVHAELLNFHADRSFDAVVGRYVLFFQPDPVAAIAHAAKQIRPQGLIVFHEMDLANRIRSYPDGTLFERMYALAAETDRRGGVWVDLGLHLTHLFLDAGLPWPTIKAEVPVGGEPGSFIYRWFTETLRSLLPRIEQFGLASAAELDLDTLVARMEAEAITLRPQLIGPLQFGAWTRNPSSLCLVATDKTTKQSVQTAHRNVRFRQAQPCPEHLFRRVQMALLNHSAKRMDASAVRDEQPSELARVRLAGELFNGRCRPGESLKLSEVGAQYQLDEDSVLKIFREFQTRGMVSLSGNGSAVFQSPSPKEMQEAYEVRAALEEVGGRAAARVLKGNTAELQRELDAMRAAFSGLDLDSFVEHDTAFHRSILQVSQNEVLLRVWDSLAVDLRTRAVIGKISRGCAELVESHQPIVDALEKGRGREAGLLLRNHVETILEFLKKSESDSEYHRALRDDLEDAKEVHKAFFPHENLSIPGLVCETFYRPAKCIGGDYYDFLPLQADRWGIAIGDVCGKGISAALLMASLQASLRAQAMHAYPDLCTLIGDVDQLVLAASPKHLYASLFFAEYDAMTRVLRYVNAGHNAPMVFRWSGGECKVFRLEPSGTPLGLLEVSHFSSQTLQLETDDLLVMYTDGMMEAENREGELWGQERLETLLRACRGWTPAQIVGRVVEEVFVFAKGCSQRDDMTLVVVGVKDGDGI